jgi:outer membrane protein assembly factor BamD (BamD/ComL family)
MRNLLPWVGTSGDDRGEWIAAVNRFRKTVRWYVRIAAKLASARLPVPYRIWNICGYSSMRT